jgi:oxygen-independent coproporphyrinogen-3 oxidase
MEGIRGRLADGAEVTLEANPEDVTKETVGVWRRLGVSRLSIGVQTFQGEGLGFLKRNHGGAAAERAIEVARSEMPTVNADLIYGWPGQTVRGWQEDLARAVAAGADHLSLYNLTYEARTPIGRAVHRGKRAPEDDDLLASYYEVACAELAARGFEHDEVSNWALPGSTCRHNWLYWQDESYVGVGAGAHGYLRDEVGPGVRWWYPRDDRQFVRAAAGKAGATVEDETNGRTRETWLTEYVGSSLRTRRGVDLGRVAAVLGREVELRPTPVLAEALARRIISIDVDAAMAARPNDGLRAASRPSPRLRLVPAEWFRENAWAVEVLGSLRR